MKTYAGFKKFTMKNYSFLLGFFFLLGSLSGQPKKKTTCDISISMGYKKAFCEYDSKYSYKNIPFESSFSSIAAQFDLKKDHFHASVYEVMDDKMKDWLDVSFTDCNFRFSANDKLSGVILSLSLIEKGDGSNNKNDNLYKLYRIQENLKSVFGNPTIIKQKSLEWRWYGENLTISLSSIEPTFGMATLIIQRNNESKTEGL